MSPSFSPKVFWQSKLKANLFAIVDLEIGHFSSPSLVLKNEKDLLFGVRKKDGDIVFFPKGLDAWNWKIICGCQHVWQGETAMVLKNGNFSMFLSVMKFKQNAEWVLSRKNGFLHFLSVLTLQLEKKSTCFTKWKLIQFSENGDFSDIFGGNLLNGVRK